MTSSRAVPTTYIEFVLVDCKAAAEQGANHARALVIGGVFSVDYYNLTGTPGQRAKALDSNLVNNKLSKGETVRHGWRRTHGATIQLAYCSGCGNRLGGTGCRKCKISFAASEMNFVGEIPTMPSKVAIYAKKQGYTF